MLLPLLLWLVSWFGLGVPSRVSSDQAEWSLCLGRVPICWQPHFLAIDGKSVESSQVLLGARSGQHIRRRQRVAGSPGQPPPMPRQGQTTSLGAQSRAMLYMNGAGGSEVCLPAAHGLAYFKPFIQQVFTKLLLRAKH